VNPLYSLAAQRARHRCEYWRAPEAVFNLPFEVEHVVPTARSGPDDEWNRALSCRSCNLYKSDRIEAFDDVSQEVAPLFHPRHDRWEEQFSFDRESGSIIGLTSTGRATVTVLQLNRPIQLAARRQWMLLGLFP
jgi:hypothetical protein